MENKPPIRLKTISEFHKSHDLAQPEHPLISVIDFGSVPRTADISTKSWAFDFYQVSLKRGIDFKMKYGQQAYEFDEGVMGFIVPNQVFRIAPPFCPSSFGLDVACTSRFFMEYAINEALFLSEKEEATLNGIIEKNPAGIPCEYR
ncbi:MULTISPECIES: hypothetical protein [Olivibacter]|uniref:AraC family transcriptional regulator n=1 Tax=Olivibacter jilunii TaxID=985016 RepID=A0ABW6B3K3_9SPHI